MLKSTLSCRLIGLAITGAFVVNAQYGPDPYGRDRNGSFPHVYPGMPEGQFSPEWQDYFQVTERLPNVTFDLGRNWAGNIPVGRAGPNNTLFFWAFEKEEGSLTAGAGERSDEPWGIFLNSAGTSGMFGLAFENGPIQIADDYTVHKNNFSWNHLADWVWVDTIINSGLSTADLGVQPLGEDLIGKDFLGFLSNLVEVFPSLKTRPLYLTGTRGATFDLSYIMKNYFNLASPPVNIRKLAIANAGFGTATGEAFLTSILDTYPQLIQYNTSVYQYFQHQVRGCGYDLNLTYPPASKYPTLRSGHSPCDNSTTPCLPPLLSSPSVCGGLFSEMTIYTANTSPPWNASRSIDSLDCRDGLNPFSKMDGSIFFNDNATRTALHAPLTSVKRWFYQDDLDVWFVESDSTVPVSEFIDELATNLTKHDIPLVLYNGNDNMYGGNFDTELSIQNATFGGVQGFTRKPSTPWTDDNGVFAGIVHQERNWTFIVVHDAQYLVARRHPERAFVLLREFILGNNQTGLVTETNGVVSVVGGEDPTLYENGILPGADGIFIGAGTTQGVYTYPTATIEAWKSFRASVHAAATPTSTAKNSARFRLPE